MWLCRFSDFLDLCYWFKAGCLLKISGFFLKNIIVIKMDDMVLLLQMETSNENQTLLSLNMLSAILDGSYDQKYKKWLPLLYHSR